MDLAIAAYEWQAAIVLVIVAKYFLPIFLEKKIYTMPQFLELRFGQTIKSMMAVFWVVLYTAVNLTAVLWLGGLALTALTGWNVVASMIGLAAFAVVYSLYGGLKAVALTDIIQVVVLVAGGFAITGIVLSLVGDGAGIFAGLGTLMGEIPGHFQMILSLKIRAITTFRESGRFWAGSGCFTFLIGASISILFNVLWERRASLKLKKA